MNSVVGNLITYIALSRLILFKNSHPLCKFVASCADNLTVLLLGLEEVCRVDCEPIVRSWNCDVSCQ